MRGCLGVRRVCLGTARGERSIGRAGQACDKPSQSRDLLVTLDCIFIVGPFGFSLRALPYKRKTRFAGFPLSEL